MSVSGNPYDPAGQGSVPNPPSGDMPPPYPPPAPPPPPPPSAGSSSPSFSVNVKLPPIDAAALSKTPWVVGAVAILVGLVLYWFGSVVSAFEANVGYDLRDRLLHILGGGDAGLGGGGAHRGSPAGFGQ